MKELQYIFGYHAISMALTVMPHNVRHIYVHELNGKRHSEVLKLTKSLGISWQQVTRKELEDLTHTTHHQGIVASILGEGIYPETHLDVILRKHQNETFLLVLDGVQDPHNLGACLRTANAAGVHAVIVPKDRACGLTSVVYKVASGAVGSTPLIQVTNLARVLDMLKKHNIWIYGTTEDANETFYQIDLTPPLALVFGAEGDGLRRLTKDKCDRLLNIPMRGVVQNLNVAVAVGVVLFEALRQQSSVVVN